jgi:hypothetical protein
MGSVQSSTIKSNNQVSNNLIQTSYQSCHIGCHPTQKSNITIINSKTGNINVDQLCAIDNVQCIMSTNFDASLENILESMASQDNSAVNGFSINFAGIKQNVDLNQLIENQITQIQTSSCDINEEEVEAVNMFVLNSQTGDINMSQKGTISNALCNMDNTAKATSYSKATADATQKASVKTIAGMFIALLVLCIIIIVIVMIVTSTSKGKSGGGGGNKPINVNVGGGGTPQPPQIYSPPPIPIQMYPPPYPYTMQQLQQLPFGSIQQPSH